MAYMIDKNSSPLNVYLFLIVILIIFLVLVVLSLNPTLERASFAAQILTTLSLFLAVAEYLRKNEKERNAAVSQQIRMFRLEIIPLMEQPSKLIGNIEDKSKVKYPHIEMIDEFSARWFFANRPRETLIQQKFWNAVSKQQGEDWSTVTTRLLNSMEELASSIKITGTVESGDLRSIRTAFVQTIETFAWPLILIGPYDTNMYAAIKFVYSNWRDKTVRLSPEVTKSKIDEDIGATVSTLREAMSTEEYREFDRKLNQVSEPPAVR